MNRVAAYVDGFNLYNGLREKHGRRYLWLNLELLVNKLLKPYQELVILKYFTASIRNDPAAHARQSAYLGALDTYTKTEIVLGRFQEKHMRCRSCGNTWRSYEEKETDVSIAIELLEDGAGGFFDTALLISADSDLCPAVRALKRLRPDARVIAAFPPRRRSDELRAVSNGSFTIGDAVIRSSLLPDSVRNPDQWRVYTRPRTWR